MKVRGSKMFKLLKKYEEILKYLFIGGCTTVVSLASYFVFANVMGMHYQAANVLSWALAVTFAYITNKTVVFRSKYDGVKRTLLEMGSFVSFRIASLAVELISIFFFVQIRKIDDKIVKLMNQVIVTVLNYLFSKFFIFQDRRQQEKIMKGDSGKES